MKAAESAHPAEGHQGDGVLVARDRVLGVLKGIATGDAIGKQTENFTRGDICRWYPGGIRGFEGAPGSVIPRYANNRKRKWRFGETTDDTERTIAVARAILQHGEVGHEHVGVELLKCGKCVHPGVASLWEFHQAGDPARVADHHDGCGAASRVAPVGMRYRSHRLDDIVTGAREASMSTHGGSLAIAAAAATAAAVSAAVEGASPDEIIGHAGEAGARAERQWPDPLDRSVARAVRDVHRHVRRGDMDPDAIAAHCFPNVPLTIVPLALALGTVMESAAEAILLAANVGGDSDSVASIAGAILGARRPDTVNDAWVAVIEQVNGHHLEPLARDLAVLRS